MTQYLTPPLTEPSSDFQLQPQSSLLSVSVPLLFRFQALIPDYSFSMKFPSLSHTLSSLQPSELTPPSLCISVSHALWFFLFFFLSPPSLGVSRHVKTCTGGQRERRGEREDSCGCEQFYSWQVGGVTWGQGSVTGQHHTSSFAFKLIYPPKATLCRCVTWFHVLFSLLRCFCHHSMTLEINFIQIYFWLMIISWDHCVRNIFEFWAVWLKLVDFLFPHTLFVCPLAFRRSTAANNTLSINVTERARSWRAVCRGLNNNVSCNYKQSLKPAVPIWVKRKVTPGK